MITVSSDIQAAIEADRITPVSLITLNFPSSAGGVLRITDAPRDVTVGSNTYLSLGLLKAVAPPQTIAVVDRDIYSLQLSDVDNSLRTRIESAPAGVLLNVQLTFITTTITAENTVVTTTLNEALDVYSGVLSNAELQIQNNDPVLSLEFTGQLAKLDSNFPSYTTPESQQQVDSSDTSMDYVHFSDEDDSLQWGRS